MKKAASWHPRLVLVGMNARFTHSNLAIHSMAASLWAKFPEAKEQIQRFSCHINQPLAQNLSKLFRLDAEIYCFSAYIWNAPLLMQLMERLRLVRPDALIAVGGPEVAYHAKETLEASPFIDMVFTGEGEEAVCRLYRQLQELPQASCRSQFLAGALRYQMDLVDLCVKAPLGLRQFPAHPLLDMDQLPYPYPDGLAHLKHRTIYYESSRGCPFHCSYCLSSRPDERLRFRSLPLVFQDLERLCAGELKLIKFIDRSYNADPKRARKIWQFLMALDQRRQAKGLGPICFHFEIEARLLNASDFSLLAKARPGLFQFEVGIQSFQPEVLRRIRRAPDTSRIVRALKTLQAQGNIHTHADLIFGLPGETWELSKDSFNKGLAIASDHLQCGFLKILKGTAMAEMAKELGYRWLPDPPYEVLSSDVLDVEQLLLLKQLVRVFELFSNSGNFPQSLPALYQAFDSPFDCYLALGTAFEQAGLLDRPLAREYLFVALDSFALQLDPGFQGLVEEDYARLAARKKRGWERLFTDYERPVFPSM